jgi:hypothetical protein
MIYVIGNERGKLSARLSLPVILAFCIILLLAACGGNAGSGRRQHAHSNTYAQHRP